MFLDTYDIIVVGGGHAGCEAAAAAANMGKQTLLITMNLQMLGQMSCNPAMGGIAKGQIVREIDAMGGYSGIVSDRSAIQFKMLNRSKGPAMWSPRTQNDRMLFATEWRQMLEQTNRVDFYQDMVSQLIIEGDSVAGVETALGVSIRSRAVILTNGTFLNGLIHIGNKQFSGGRSGERSSKGITEQLLDFGFDYGRMKTGTPPRVDGRSLDYSQMTEQPGDEHPQKFSYSSHTKSLQEQRSCFMTHTSLEVHDRLREGFGRSPMFNGSIKSIGPRYCPSIEDKIHRFAEKERHQIFVEPEGWHTVEVYVNGFSTSLPEEIQSQALRLVKGFEKVKFFRPGYAIEYDYFPPTQLYHTLETKLIKQLYFAGQINGTTGYEEAAAQGLMAGINAALKLNERASFILSRDEAYIGVLIDDLITKGTEEPYRMFTSRAEYRMLLRQDNADIRLSERSFKIGLADKSRQENVNKKLKQSERVKKFFRQTSISPKQANPILVEIDSAPIKQSDKISKIFSRPRITMNHMIQLPEIASFLKEYKISSEALQYAEIDLKYSGYIEKERRQAEKLSDLERILIPKSFDYECLQSLSLEAREKLKKIQPTTLAQASRISGVSPSDISVLLVYMGR